jgi:hypothetical protein
LKLLKFLKNHKMKIQNIKNNKKEKRNIMMQIILVFVFLIFVTGYIGIVSGDDLYKTLSEKKPNEAKPSLDVLTNQQIMDYWKELIKGEQGNENANKFMTLLNDPELKIFRDKLVLLTQNQQMTDNPTKYGKSPARIQKVDLDSLKLKYEDGKIKTEDGRIIVPHERLLKIETIQKDGKTDIKYTYTNKETKKERTIIVQEGVKGFIEGNNYIRNGKVIADVLSDGEEGSITLTEENENTKISLDGNVNFIVRTAENKEKGIPKITLYEKSSVTLDKDGTPLEVQGKITVRRMDNAPEIKLENPSNPKELKSVYFETGKNPVGIVFGKDTKADTSKDFIRMYDSIIDEKTGTTATNIQIGASDIKLYPLASLSSAMSINDISVVKGKTNIKIINQADMVYSTYNGQTTPRNIGESLQTFISFNGQDMWVPVDWYGGDKTLRFIEEIKSGEGDGYSVTRYDYGTKPDSPEDIPGWELRIQDSEELQRVLQQVQQTGTKMNKVDVNQIPSYGPDILATRFGANPSEKKTYTVVPHPDAPSTPGSGGGSSKGGRFYLLPWNRAFSQM